MTAVAFRKMKTFHFFAIFSKTKIDGVVVIEAEPFIDDRGAFRRHFCQEEFARNNIVTDVSQCNVSENKYANYLIYRQPKY